MIVRRPLVHRGGGKRLRAGHGTDLDFGTGNGGIGLGFRNGNAKREANNCGHRKDEGSTSFLYIDSELNVTGRMKKRQARDNGISIIIFQLNNCLRYDEEKIILKSSDPRLSS